MATHRHDSSDDQSEGSASSEWKRSSGARRIGFALDRQSVPGGAVMMSKTDVLYLLNQAIDRQPRKEAFVLKHGSEMLGCLAALNGGLFTMHFRQRMVLRHHARLASFAPGVFIPFAVTTIAQHSFGYKRLLNVQPPCLSCAYIGAISIQVCVGVAQPFVMSALASIAIGKMTHIYPLPPWSDFRGLLHTVIALSKQLRLPTVLLAASTLLNTVLITHLHIKAVNQLHAKLFESDVFVS